MIRKRYIIKGQVQGVGFRPFIYSVATKLKLFGYIKNTFEGVEIDIEGVNLDEFEQYLNNHLPPLAKIDEINFTTLKPLYRGQFEIIKSKAISPLTSLKTATIPQDVAICDDCLLDIHVSQKYDRYFATNCTNCGPRYSIIQTVPYDREHTSMKKFKLCSSCQREYNDPTNRRFHAQPIGCNSCGASLSIDNTYEDIASYIKQGQILAIKGLGGFHIVCDASNDEVVKKLRRFKNRPTKPFAIMCKDIEMLKPFADTTKKEIEVLRSSQAPIVLLKKKKPLEYIAPNIDRVGVVLPYTAFYHLLFEYLENPIVLTSANLSGEPIIIQSKDIKTKLHL